MLYLWVPIMDFLVESEYIPQSIKYIPVLFSFLGFIFALNLNLLGASFSYSLKTSSFGRKVYIFLNKRWLFDKMYTDFIALPALFFGYNFSFKTLDKGLLEIVGPAGVMQTVSQGSRQLRKMQSGLIYHYAFIMLCSLTFFMAFVGLWDFFFFLCRNTSLFYCGNGLAFFCR